MSAAGAANLACASIAFIVGCVELVSLRRETHRRARGVAGGTAFFASLYAFIGWYHYDYVTAAGVVWLVRVEFALIALMTLSLGAYASQRTAEPGYDARWWWRSAALISGFILLTPWVVPNTVRWIRVGMADRLYPQPPDSVFSIGLILFGGGLVLWSMARILRHRPTLPERVPYTVGLSIWLLTAGLDALFALQVIDMPMFLMEFGFVGFAFTMLLAHTAEHMSLLAAAGREQAILVGEREAARAATHQSELIGRSIVESVSEGIVVVDGDGRITLWNGVVHELTGTPEAVAHGTTLCDQLTLCDAARDGLNRAMHGALHDGVRTEVVVEQLGTSRSLRIVVSPHRSEHGGLGGAVVALRDITPELRLSTQMAHLDRMASLGVLAASVGHEINNPLASLQLNIDYLIAELPVHSELASIANDIAVGSRRIGAIVSELKALSRQRAVSEHQGARLDAVVHWAVRTARHAVQHHATLEVECESLPLARGDAGQLGQVLLNLLINAANAIEAGGPAENVVKVRAFVDGDVVVVEVSDTGVGIDPAIRERIFEPFFTTRPADGGTGLGLSISAEVVRASGGTITVRSEVGVGSTFRIELPIVAEAEGDSGDDLDELLDRLDGVSLFILDDDGPFLRAAKRRLGALGARVSVTSYAQELMTWIAAGLRCDVLLCDLMMPDESGVEVYERLCAEAPEIAARTIFISGGAVTEVTRRFAEEHSERVLDKPLHYPLLVSRVRGLVKALPVDNLAVRIPSSASPPAGPTVRWPDADA